MDWRDDPVGSAHRGENPMLALLGGAVERACHPRRLNYELLGNSLPLLHAHVHPRYEWEPAALITGPLWRYPDAVRAEHPYRDDEHGTLREMIRGELERLMRSAY